MYILVFQTEPCLHLMNRRNSSKNTHLTTFRNTCSNTKPFELAQGKFADIEYDFKSKILTMILTATNSKIFKAQLIWVTLKRTT